MASIRQKGRGTWEVRVFTGYDDRGRPVQVSRTIQGGKRDAERLAAQLSTGPTARSGKMTVAGLVDQYLEHKRGSLAVTTARDYGYRARRISADPLGAKPISRVTVAEVDRWHLRLRKEGIGDGQIRNLHTLLRAAFGYAVRWELIPTNPVAAATPERRKKAPREAMSVEEVTRAILASAMVHPMAPLAFRLAALAGARRAELAALRWDSVVDGRLIIARNVIIDRSLYPGDPERLKLTPTKTGERRVIALDAHTLALIEVAQRERGDRTPWMFGENQEPPAPDRIGHWWNRTRELAKFEKPWRLHDLRHWSASHAIAGGHNVRSVAARLGHADPTTTMRTYAHALDGFDQAIAQTLATALDGDSAPA